MRRTWLLVVLVLPMASAQPIPNYDDGERATTLPSVSLDLVSASWEGPHEMTYNVSYEATIQCKPGMDGPQAMMFYMPTGASHRVHSPEGSYMAWTNSPDGFSADWTHDGDGVWSLEGTEEITITSEGSPTNVSSHIQWSSMTSTDGTGDRCDPDGTVFQDGYSGSVQLQVFREPSEETTPSLDGSEQKETPGAFVPMTLLGLAVTWTYRSRRM